mmetsp:Transcript_35143/g.79272  ORF Transcript_35143/g.79272 Transcript_35143/m.79272 type:complete len:92 (+) Transcript_35143:692-967(+)
MESCAGRTAVATKVTTSRTESQEKVNLSGQMADPTLASGTRASSTESAATWIQREGHEKVNGARAKDCVGSNHESKPCDAVIHAGCAFPHV